MSEHENELAKALAENGHYDAEKAENEASRARRWFDSRLKWSGRISWMRIIFVVVVFEFAFINFINAMSTKAMIGYATMMVITVVIVSAIGVQSWVANTKINLSREIKLLRLEGLGRPTDQVALSDLESARTVSFMRRALSFWEYAVWLVALILIASASSFAALYFSTHEWPSNMASFEGAPVTVETPRIGSPIYYTIYIRMDNGVCKVSSVTPEHKESDLFTMGKGFVTNGKLSPGDSLKLDPQGNRGEYWVRFE